MSQISVTLVRADTNQEFDVELPDDAPIAELLPALVKELGLPLTGPDGNQVAYELASKRTGKEFKEKETLGTGGAKAGDVLLLTSTFVAGTDRINYITVALERDLREDDAAVLISAISLLRGVVAVEQNVTGPSDWTAEQRARSLYREKLLKVFADAEKVQS